jgi:spore coat polysaccharide biosynthesis protein SpsF
MKNYIFLQARMGSSRLPGKTMKAIRGKPLIEYVIDRLRIVGIEVVVLTSNKQADNVLASWCEEKGIKFFRGSESNVLERYYEAAVSFGASHIIRATGDNPLVEPYCARNLLEKHTELRADYSSNKSEIGSNLPDGLGVEVFSFDALERSMRHSSEPHHFEHVNEYILENKSKFNVYKDCNAGGLVDRSGMRLTVDTPDDFEKIQKIIASRQFSVEMNYVSLLEIAS